jgi:hypothetical protein
MRNRLTVQILHAQAEVSSESTCNTVTALGETEYASTHPTVTTEGGTAVVLKQI